MSPYDEVREGAAVLVGTERASGARLLLLLNVISDRVAAEAQLTEEESIEFSSDITIILSLVYKHTFRMLREYHSLDKFTSPRAKSEIGVKSCHSIRLCGFVLA